MPTTRLRSRGWHDPLRLDPGGKEILEVCRACGVGVRAISGSSEGKEAPYIGAPRLLAVFARKLHGDMYYIYIYKILHHYILYSTRSCLICLAPAEQSQLPRHD